VVSVLFALEVFKSSFAWSYSHGTLKSAENTKNRVVRAFSFTHLHTKMANISTQRTPLGERSSNNVRGPELTPEIRGKILGMHECGYNVPFIMGRLKLSRYAVRYTID
jgi:hypothetical protein